MDFDGVKYLEAIKRLAESVGMTIPKDGAPTPRRVIQRRLDAESMPVTALLLAFTSA